MLGTSFLSVRCNLFNTYKPRISRNTHQTVPGVFVQETHGNVESGTTPHLQTVCIGQRVAGFLCDVDHVDGTKTSSEKRLVSISPGGVHDESTGIGADCLGKCLGALVDNDVTPTSLAGNLGDQRRSILGVLAALEFGNDNFCLETGLALIKRLT